MTPADFTRTAAAMVAENDRAAGHDGVVSESAYPFIDESSAFSKGARLLVTYADGRPDETFIIDDVHDNDDGSQTLDVHPEGMDRTDSFLWHSGHDESRRPTRR
jgi:hypothetical protein